MFDKLSRLLLVLILSEDIYSINRKNRRVLPQF